MKQETFSFSTLFEENVTSLLRTKKKMTKKIDLYTNHLLYLLKCLDKTHLLVELDLPL